MIYILSSKKVSAFGFDATVRAQALSSLPADFIFDSDDRVYLDISGLSAAEIKKLVTRHTKRFPGTFWGIIDPKGEACDAASFFFDGAGDYIGQAAVKRGIGKKRLNTAFLWARERNGAGSAAAESALARSKSKAQKLPAGKFEGWKTVKPGVSAPFFFVYVSIAGKANLHTLIGEANTKAAKNRLRETLQQFFREADSLLWMEADDSFLFLVPPRQANGKLAVEAALKVLANSRLIDMEKLELPFPVDFTVAMHYGKTTFHEPGKTGAVISESVNYIFHLGSRKGEPGRLTVSADVPPEAFPEGLLDIFKPAGEFEGIPVRHSRRFVCRG